MKKLEKCYLDYDRFNTERDPIESVEGYDVILAALNA